MGTFVSTFIPYDATGRAVNLNTEYMYRDDGLRLKVIRFEYYKSDDADCNWFILSSIDSSNAIKADRYKVTDLYVTPPSNANTERAMQDLHKLVSELVKIKYNLAFGCTSDSELFDKFCKLEVELKVIIRKLENPDAE